MTAAIQAREVMQLLQCAEKPVAVAIYKRGKLCNCFPGRENLWRLHYKRGKLCNCCHKWENLLRCNRSAGNYATTAMRGKTSGGCNTSVGIYAMELLPCAAKLVAVAI